MSGSEIRFPDIEVELTNHDGNPALIIGRVSRALRRAKVSETEVAEFIEEATSGDYNNVLITCMRWVDVT